VIMVRQVGDGLWLAIAGPASSGGTPARLRLAADRAAADRAEAMAVAASSRSRFACAISRSHTRGVGAALVGPASARLGVDIVALERLRDRHAAAVVGEREWEALAGRGPDRATLAWALKEAAAKATGDPSRWFPGGLRIVAAGNGLQVQRADGSGPAFAAAWMRWGDHLCAWVWAGVVGQAVGRAVAHPALEPP